MSAETSSPPEGRPLAARRRGSPRLSPRQAAFLRGACAESASAPRLILCVYALLLLTRLIDAAFLERGGRYLSEALLQLLVFPLPAYLYIRLKGKGYARSLRFAPVRLSHLFLILSGVMLLIGGCTLLSMMCGMMRTQPSFTLYDTFASSDDGSVGATTRLILTYGLLPAFCEELVFRGILCAEYEGRGILYAAAVSSLFFAFLHFDLAALPVYLFAGFLLAAVMYATRSVLASMIVHFGYNLFGVFAQAGLSGYCRSTGSLGLFVVMLIVLLLLSAAFFCGETARILRRRARAVPSDGAPSPGLNRLPARAWLPALGKAFASPAGLGAVALWLIGAVARLVR